jgi:hypothetical protein
MLARKRKLEIQTEPSLLRTAPQPIQAYNTTSPMMTHPPTSAYYTERRASITSSGTESSCEGNSSPITAPFGSPRGLSLPPLSPPQQSYDKLFGASYCMYPVSISPSSPPLHAIDPSVKLPPIRHVLHKRQKLTRSEEEDAVLAMMQLSHHY